MSQIIKTVLLFLPVPAFFVWKKIPVIDINNNNKITNCIKDKPTDDNSMRDDFFSFLGKSLKIISFHFWL